MSKYIQEVVELMEKVPEGIQIKLLKKIKELLNYKGCYKTFDDLPELIKDGDSEYDFNNTELVDENGNIVGCLKDGKMIMNIDNINEQ